VVAATAGESLRVVFFGTPEFAIPTLEHLCDSPHPVVAVVTQPDRPVGRGLRSLRGPVKVLAEERGIPVWQPERLKDPSFVLWLAEARADLGVVAAYGKILPDDLLRMPRLGLINVHGSLLPRYRGAAPVQRAVMAGEPVTGVTIMRVVHDLDAGPLFASATRRIDPDETGAEVEHDLAMLGAKLLLQVVDALAAGGAPETLQDSRLATYAPRLRKEDGLIDWRRPAVAIHNQVRALRAWTHACTFLGHARYLILKTALPAAPGAQPCGGDARAGQIVEASGDTLAVAAGDGGHLRILEIQAEGRRPLRTRAFLAGNRMLAGQVFEPGPDDQSGTP
jgi:methionyl-tRNA formyltransferase